MWSFSSACVLIREGAQAHEALVLCTLPSADQLARDTAVSELEDVVRGAANAIALLARAKPPYTS